MIIGVFLKNYKVYDGIKFVPISYSEYFSAYFGQNGVGKSSILEALDTFFNGRPWNPFKSGKGGNGYVNTPYVVPLFLISKNEASVKLKKYKDKLETLSDYFWNVESIINSSEASAFFEFRKVLATKINQNDYYLFAAGIKEDEPKNIFFGTFQRQSSFLEKLGIKRVEGASQSDQYKEEDEKINDYFKDSDDFLLAVKDLYHFIYISSDVDITTYTQLETQNMQKLMHKDIKKEIQKAITQKKLDEINNYLKDFVDTISEKLGDYTYEKPAGGKNTITMPDLVNKIIKAYFSIRVLTKKEPVKVPVDNLSSGEKRKALIDVAYAFLDDNQEHDRNIILAIDEPEISLHISACYEQFEKLKHISSKKHQIILTTHWYGFLPVLGNGIAHNIANTIDSSKNFGSEQENTKEVKVITSYSLEKYQEEINLSRIKHEFPHDVYLKGIYDLIQSIVASLRADKPYKYILVEGSSDKIYLEKYLENYINNDNLRIMPLGGCGEVKRVMEHLFMATDGTDLKYTGKVLGIIDTDDTLMASEKFVEKGHLKFRRIKFDDTQNDIMLENITSLSGNYITSIEDVLEPAIFDETLREILHNENIEYFSFMEKINKDAVCSFDTYDLTNRERKELKQFFDRPGMKKSFSLQYVEKNISLKKLSIIKEIIQILDLDINKYDNLENPKKRKTKKVAVLNKGRLAELPSISANVNENFIIEEN